jgi:hypothetical protein
VAHDVLTKTRSLLKGKTDNVTSLIDLVVNGLYIDPNLPALKYGRENEYEAADTYYDNQHTLHSNLKVDVCGMFVDTTHSFLSASPDRLVSCDCCGKGLLEIKCPISIAGQNPQQAPVYYLEDKDNVRSLRRSHKYYTQVQMQMAVTKREWCDFFVWSKSGFHLERINFDSDLWMSYETTLTEGFLKYIVPSIVSSSS